MDSPTFRLSLLGRWVLERDGEALIQFGSRIDERLLAFLALRPGVDCSRVEIGEMFWGDIPEAKARKLLSLHLFTLLQRLSGVGLSGAIEDARDTIRLRGNIPTDVQEFTERALAGSVAATDAARAGFLQHAVLLYGGDLLPAYSDPWAVEERMRLRASYDQIAGRFARLLDPSGGLESLVGTLPSAAWLGLRRLGITDFAPRTADTSSSTDSSVVAVREAPALPVEDPWLAPHEPVIEQTQLDALDSLAKFVAERAARLDSADRDSAIAEITMRLDAIQMCLERPATKSSYALQLQMAADMWRYWYRSGGIARGRQFLESLLRERFEAPRAVQAMALHAVGALANLDRDQARGIRYLRSALELWHELGDDASLLRSLINLGLALQEERSYEEAHGYNAQAIAIARRLGRESSLSKALLNQAIVESYRANHVEARRLLEERLTLRLLDGDHSGKATTHCQLATTALFLDDFPQARLHAEAALRYLEDLPNDLARCGVHRVMGRVLYWEDQLEASKEHYVLSIEAAQAFGNMAEVGRSMAYLALTLQADGDSAQAALVASNSSMLLRSVGDTWTLGVLQGEMHGLQKRSGGTTSGAP